MLKGFNKADFPIKQESEKAIQFSIPYILSPKEGGKLKEPRQMTLNMWVPKMFIDKDGNISESYVEREVDNMKRTNIYLDVVSIKKSLGHKLK